MSIQLRPNQQLHPSLFHQQKKQQVQRNRDRFLNDSTFQTMTPDILFPPLRTYHEKIEPYFLS